ncbi:MAG: helix-turn-helix transcriptional regulator, partial [Chloroflexi bacterium]|nr:helix-turn-helix transcriptional regulator [Chloroflexota bacterium]
MRENRAGLGSRLGMLRERTGLLQKDIARLVNVSHITVKNWENGRYKPSAEHLKKLIEVYLRQKAFSHGCEQEEAEELWRMAALNIEFDKEWFVEMRAKLIPPVKKPRESSLETGEQETGESDAQWARVHTVISGFDETSRGIDERVVMGNDSSTRFGDVWEDFIFYVGNLSLKIQDRRRMLDKIHSMWIKGLLERSLQNVAVIELELGERPDVVTDPWRQSLQEMHQP